ncbi:alpha/beta hydrolase-fold protein [Alteromonas sp. AMM-1]|uniref:alpha/beta hydrolase-fold protein n=1 Tax=Alteromonas sp. AMM-1 TaxID=3394233 RepID=UPI0039A68882
MRSKVKRALLTRRLAIIISLLATQLLWEAKAAGTTNINQPLFSITPAQPVLQLSVTKGSYVAGEAKSEGEFALCLANSGPVSSASHCVRQLVPEQSGRAGFYFVASSDSPFIVSQSNHPVDITLLNVVAPEHQTQAMPGFVSPMVARAYQTLQAGHLAEAVWRSLSQNGSPIIEPTSKPGESLLTFIHKGAQFNALIFGAPDRDHGWMTRLGNSDIWFKTYTVPDSTVLSYQIAPDVPQFAGSPFEQRVALKATAQRDPLNPRLTKPASTDPHFQFSMVALPNAPTFESCVDACPLLGDIHQFSLTSAGLNNSRLISVYTSPTNQHPAPPIQVILFDGMQFSSEVNVLASLERAVLNNRIPALEVVLVDSLDNSTRAMELPDNPQFTQMLTHELLPAVASVTSRSFAAYNRVLAGASYGGLGAFTHALRASDYFGNAVVMSGSFWWADRPDYPQDKYFISERVMASPMQSVRYAISAGLFESSPTGQKGILSGSRHLRDMLTLKGYEVYYREYAGGHDYTIWERALIDGLMSLFPVESNKG